jgi:hypothetical protein
LHIQNLHGRCRKKLRGKASVSPSSDAKGGKQFSRAFLGIVEVVPFLKILLFGNWFSSPLINQSTTSTNEQKTDDYYFDAGLSGS